MSSDETCERNFCSDCGFSLHKIGTFCSSRLCTDCGKEIFYVRPGENGGVEIEKGEKFHITGLTISLDPKEGGIFYRPGFESFIREMFVGSNVTKENIVSEYKKKERELDDEIVSLDCVKHCDINTDEGFKEAIGILDKEGLDYYKYRLLRSSALRVCYTSIETGDALEAAFSSYKAEVFKELSILESEHIKEILWLGYCCYVDLCKNEESDFNTMANDGLSISSRLKIQGVNDSTLKPLLEFELERRKNDREEYYKEKEISLKERGDKLKILGFFLTLLNGIILLMYKNWMG